MVGGEGGNLNNRGAAPGDVFDSSPSDSLF